jgi:hypothetical protein
MTVKPGMVIRYLKHSVRSDEAFFSFGEIYTVSQVFPTERIHVDDIKPFLYPEQYEIVHFNNAVNRLLYPDYIEKDGYLVPKQ